VSQATVAGEVRVVRQPAVRGAGGATGELTRAALLICKTDDADGLSYVSRELLEVVGGTASIWTGRERRDLCHDAMPLAIDALMAQRLACHQEFLGVGVLKGATGAPVWCLLQASPVIDRVGQVLRGAHLVHRWVDPSVQQRFEALYYAARERERACPTYATAERAGRETLEDHWSKRGLTYEAWCATMLHVDGSVR